MAKFSKKSLSKLSECNTDLQRIFNEVIKHYDCTVLCGYRDEQTQNELYDEGFTQVKFPNSNHNSMPSNAVDVVPYPIDWENIKRFKEFCHFVKGVAVGMNIEITSGGLDWKDFKDYPHFELKIKEVI